MTRRNSQWTGANQYSGKVDLRERFDSYIEPEPMSGCHLWFCATDPEGYGLLSIEGHRRRANRVAYELAYGTFPISSQVLHRCDNPPCVNPLHLYLGTALDNMRDKLRRGRNTNANKTVCKYGHPITAGHAYIYNGKRFCKVCHGKSNREQYIKRRDRLMAAKNTA